MSDRSIRTKNRTVVALVLFISSIALYAIVKVFAVLPQIFQDVTLGLVAGMCVHLIDRLWLYRDTQEEFERLKDDVQKALIERFEHLKAEFMAALIQRLESTAQTIEDDVRVELRNTAKNVENVTKQIEADVRIDLEKAIEDITRGANSLEAMKRSGIARIFANRQEAVDGIYKEFCNRNTKNIRLIGVTFHDTIRGAGADDLSKAWNIVVEHITKAQPFFDKCTDIKLLIIDPHCQGALLRSEGESRGQNQFVAGKLQGDVDLAIEPLLDLQRQAKLKGMSFEARVYRVAPILFLCWNERVAFTQQYYFWSERAKPDDARMPIIRFDAANDGTKSVHSELEKHFDWIWQHASVDLVSYKSGHAVGVDFGICKTGISNIYADPEEGKKRIAYLLSTAQKKVRIQGVSLHSYFSPGVLQDSLQRLLAKDDIDLGIYFLNPTCEQAKFRAFREMSFRQSVNRARYFTASLPHEDSTLYRETLNAQKQLAGMLCEISRERPNWDPGSRLHCGFYSTAPACFVLQVDDTILIEQYHYGKLVSRDNEARVVLGKDLPVVEYVKKRSELFKEEAPTAYTLLESHLDFVAAQSELFENGWWKQFQPAED